MSLLLMRAAILAQGGATAAPVDSGTVRELDVTRRPAGYTLSDGNQTAINTAGGTNYLRWVPVAKPILPSDGRRYWEVLCGPGGAATVDGYLGVVSAEQREEYDAGNNPITLGSIGYRGNGTLWSSTTATAAQQLTGLPAYGAGDVVMFVLDPAGARLWIGRNGIWRDDPVAAAATWTTAASAAFYPQIHGRNPGDGGTLRSLPAQFSYPVPPGTVPLGFDEPDLLLFEAHGFIELGWDSALSIAAHDLWRDLGGGAFAGSASAAAFREYGGGSGLTCAAATLYIELDIS